MRTSAPPSNATSEQHGAPWSWHRATPRHLRTMLLGLLAANAFIAVFVGATLMLDPSGEKLGLSTNMLAHAPFGSFFVPGLVFLLAIGGTSVIAFVELAQRAKHAHGWTQLAGITVCGIVAVQILTVGARSPLQAIAFLLGIAIMGTSSKLPGKHPLAPKSLRRR